MKAFYSITHLKCQRSPPKGRERVSVEKDKPVGVDPSVGNVFLQEIQISDIHFLLY